MFLSIYVRTRLYGDIYFENFKKFSFTEQMCVFKCSPAYHAAGKINLATQANADLLPHDKRFRHSKSKKPAIGSDGIGSIVVKWDNGSTLSVVYGEDHCRLI